MRLEYIPQWLHQSEQYKFLLSNRENNDEFEIDKIRLKEDDTINDINDFITLFETCNYWGMEYPIHMYHFIIDNQNDVLEYLYPQYALPSAKLLIQSIVNRVTYSLDFNSNYGLHNENLMSLIIKQYSFEYNIQNTYEHDNLDVIYRFLDCFERILNIIKDPTISHCYIDENIPIYDKNDKTLRIDIGGNIKSFIILKSVNTIFLIIELERLVEKCKTIRDEFNSK